MAADSPAISAEGLTKFYGSNRGIQDVTLDVARGEVFGLLGPNGAGKTTFIRSLLDLIHPTGGRALVLGLDSRRDGVELRRRIGYVPGELALYDGLTGRDHIRYFAGLRGGVGGDHALEVAARFDLDVDRPAGELSKGNKQKLGLALAFMHKPEVLLLDEPTSGLDPLLQQEFRSLLTESAQAGVTVLLSSHVLAEVEHTADRVAIVREGFLVAVAGMDEIKRRAVRRLDVRFAEPVEKSSFDGVPGVREVLGDGPALTLVTEGPMDAVVKTLSRYEVVSLVSNEVDLEDVFMSYFRDSP